MIHTEIWNLRLQSGHGLNPTCLQALHDPFLRCSIVVPSKQVSGFEQPCASKPDKGHFIEIHSDVDEVGWFLASYQQSLSCTLDANQLEYL